jgi:putative ABC transport system substrate-binding protein
LEAFEAQMKRRGFITLIGGAAAWPLAASAQQARRPLIAILFGSDPTTAPDLAEFSQQMRALGYVEGRDYDSAVRVAYGDLTRMPALASELGPVFS